MADSSFTFPLFNSFPLEIQSLILNSCSPNDRICLSLANKTLYSLADYKDVVSLRHIDGRPYCGVSIMQASDNIWALRYRHRQECHNLCWAESNKRREAEGLSPCPLKRCRTRRYGVDHCECFSRKYKLHSRLRNWMPKSLNYCGQCNKFTKRKRQHKGRCYHGQSKLRQYEGNFWTHRSRGGAFGRKLWKKWFNSRAMNRLEGRLRDENAARSGTASYELRKLKPKKVDTHEVRGSKS